MSKRYFYEHVDDFDDEFWIEVVDMKDGVQINVYDPDSHSVIQIPNEELDNMILFLQSLKTST